MAHMHRNRWRVKWLDKAGKQRSKTFPSKTPKKVVDDFEQKLRLGMIDRSLVEGSAPKLRPYSVKWLRTYPVLKKRAPSTLMKDRYSLDCHILPAFGDWMLSEITAPDVLHWQLNLAQKLAPQSVNNTVSTLSSILRMAVLEGEIPHNVCTSVPRVHKQERTPTFWTEEELLRFLSVARDMDHRVFQVVFFAATTGLRPGEIMGLKRDCLNFEGGYVDVRRNFCTKRHIVVEGTKTGKSRMVPVPAMILQVLADKRSLPPDSQVFPGLSNSFGWRYIRPVALKAQVKPIRFHDLRHTFASHLVMHGKHPVEIKDLLGHSKLSSTDVYMHLTKQVKQGATDCLVAGLQSLTRPGGTVVPLFGGT